VTDEERRRLSDNQILSQFQRGDEIHDAIEKDVSQNRENLAVLVDELTSFRSEAREQFTQSRADRDSLKCALDKSQRESREQFAGISDCISDLKAWQQRADRLSSEDRQQRDKRQTSQDAIYQELVDEFKFRRRLGKWRNSFLVTVGMILGLVISGHSIWEMIKHLFDHPQP
jgi:hypothetical protein